VELQHHLKPYLEEMTMPTKIQMRRGTAAQWTSANPVLLSGEQGFETDTKNAKIGDGVTAWNSLGYAFIPNSLIDAAGDLIVGSADNTVGRLALGSNGHVLTVDTAGTGVAKVKWAAAPAELPSQSGNSGKFLTTDGTNPAWAAAGGKVLQVVSTTKTDTFSTTSTSFTDLTGLSASITPASSGSTILVVASLGAVTIASSPSGSYRFAMQVVRDSTAIGVGAAAGSRTRVGTIMADMDTEATNTVMQVFLDSPSTTSATTYKVQVVTSQSNETLSVNTSGADTDNASNYRAASTLTLIEIGA
jgi:hypothetical protein